jgi:hypothetical protein
MIRTRTRRICLTIVANCFTEPAAVDIRRPQPAQQNSPQKMYKGR